MCTAYSFTEKLDEKEKEELEKRKDES